MHAQSASSGRHIDEHRPEIGVLGQQRRELVHDDDQPRNPDLTHIPGPCGRQERLTPTELRCEARDAAPCAFLIEVRDHRRDLSQRPQRLEGRATLEVSQEEGDPVGAVVRSDRGDPADEQLALARPRRAG